MFHSAESRWFFEGRMPDEVLDWFVPGGRGHVEPERVDDYLLLPGCATTGVKLRAGNLEIKSMTRASEPVAYASGVSGYQDAWVKWSCKAGDVEALRRMLGATGDRWASVIKSRRLRLFSLDAGAPVELADVFTRLSGGCQVELTEIGVSTGVLDTVQAGDDDASLDQWWSLSLEAFAHGARDVTATSLAHLTEVANHLFREPPPCRLDANHAASYPAWLMRLT